MDKFGNKCVVRYFEEYFRRNVQEVFMKGGRLTKYQFQCNYRSIFDINLIEITILKKRQRIG